MRHFSIEEFKCSCCGNNRMNWEFLCKLDFARALAGVPFRITSGYRCHRHNATVSTPNSSHVKGLAADILCTNSEMRFKIIKALLDAGFTRIGVREDFIHVDFDRGKTQNVIWIY